MPETQQPHAAGQGIVAAFMREALPKAPDAMRLLAGELIKTTPSEIGKRFTEVPRGEAEIAHDADGLADMSCGYLAEPARR